MPATLSYPGVYIEEIPSGVRTITGVATSIPAFVGWATRGPVDEAGLILSWSDFVRVYGGLDARSFLGYAVYHFFNNGGSQCYVVRLVDETAAVGAVTLDGKLTFTAANPGIWSAQYSVAAKPRTGDATRFAIEVSQTSGGNTILVESFQNLSMNPADFRFAPAIINDESHLLKASPASADNVSAPAANAASLPAGKDGAVLDPAKTAFATALQVEGGGVHLLDRVDLFNLLCVPGLTTKKEVETLQKFCRDHRALLIADAAPEADFAAVASGPGAITGDNAINSAFYFPWINAPDPAQANKPRAFPPCGFVAGIYARTDVQRGVWKAPAGTEASLTGVSSLTYSLTDSENGVLNKQGINCIRNFKVYGTIAWGARTLRGDDEIGSEWKYIPVRRTALFLEESLYRALKWVVFEPNDEPLWAQIRLNVGAFLHDLFRQGAFQGTTPKDAYFVKCDRETTTQSDVNRGVVNILVGFAPLKPAEFVVIQLQQMAGAIAT